MTSSSEPLTPRRRASRAGRRAARRPLDPDGAPYVPPGDQPRYTVDEGVQPGRRRRPPLRRRAAGLPGTIGVTTLGALVPGSGFLWTGRKGLGWVVLNTFLAIVAFAVWYLPHDLDSALDRKSVV